jgi:hypothetical protein
MRASTSLNSWTVNLRTAAARATHGEGVGHGLARAAVRLRWAPTMWVRCSLSAGRALRCAVASRRRADSSKMSQVQAPASRANETSSSSGAVENRSDRTRRGARLHRIGRRSCRSRRWRWAGRASSSRMTPALVSARACRHGVTTVRMAPRSRDRSQGGSYIHRLTDRVSARLWLSCVCFGFRSGISVRRRQGRTVAWTVHADDFSCCDRSLALTEQTSAGRRARSRAQ